RQLCHKLPESLHTALRGSNDDDAIHQVPSGSDSNCATYGEERAIMETGTKGAGKWSSSQGS
ncbi:hypothetical protein, partial [Rhizomicrobium electricum]|uniref:hypothetical protein n=1 Tax=Rhizomicrobium electricum TaxID=480070 RepID=UPI001ABB1813